MEEADNIKFMRRCIDLASRAEGMTYPNPMVGAVIVCNGRIIGEGYHLRSGEPHAEVNAINSVSDVSMLKTSTLYVNLEPCTHFGKTPPCADFIISREIPDIVIGSIDTSDKVSGEGVKRLTRAGCNVTTGIAEQECRRLNRRFFAFHEKRRPYITLKWAQSADGYIDMLRSEDSGAEPVWISGKPERVLVHKWRSCEQTILVGAGTVRTDNPLLNVREWKGSDPIKLVLSSSGTFGASPSQVFAGNRTVVFTHNAQAGLPDAEKVILKRDIPSAVQICEYLYGQGIQSLFIEGGAQVINHFISSGLWDEARIFRGRKFFAGGVMAPCLEGTLFSETIFSGSSLEIYLKNGS